MARNQRMNFSLPPDVVDTLEQQDNMSAYVAAAVREYDDG
jgi:hypothetical protein